MTPLVGVNLGVKSGDRRILALGHKKQKTQEFQRNSCVFILVAGGSGRLVGGGGRKFQCRPLNMATAIFSRLPEYLKTLVLRRVGVYRGLYKRKTLEMADAISEVLIPNSQRQKNKAHQMVCLAVCGKLHRKRYRVVSYNEPAEPNSTV